MSKLIHLLVAVSVAVPFVKQSGAKNCLPASVESVDKSFGGNISQYDIRSRLGKNNGAILDERIEELRRNGLQEENLQTLHIYIMQVTNQLLSVKDFKEVKFFYFMEPCL